MRVTLLSRRWFLGLWAVLLLAKLVLAARLPLFVDEAFYWQEGMHPAWAYSDLPALTAWLARLGVAIGGDNTLALRMPFLLLAACLPWLVARIAAREYGEAAGWQAGAFAMLLPLAGTLGLLALPDVPMALATLLCMDAGTRLLRSPGAAPALELALGLGIGALCHYRFFAVIGVGAAAMLLLPEGRRALRDPRVLVALAFGVMAWTPLLAWNLGNADAGLRFQLVDRHPWAFHPGGLWFLLEQALLVTPLLFVALALAAWRHLRGDSTIARYFAWLGVLMVVGFFVLGFFADTERVSFHWPLPGYFALLPLLPGVLRQWPAWLRRATTMLAALGLLALLGYYAAVSIPVSRAEWADSKAYPANFAGWDPLARDVRAMRAAMPADTRILADNFKVGAELGFALHDADIAVLPHPLNVKHGRAPQLGLWGLRVDHREALGPHPVLLVVGASEVEYKFLLARYHALCTMLGPLPAPRTVSIDHGRQRFLLFALPRTRAAGPCTAPAMSWIDVPVAGARVGRRFEVAGWAFKDGVGIAAVDVTLDGRRVARATYGQPLPHVVAFWKISTDTAQPGVGFRAQVALPPGTTGTHWLGLTLHGKDGSVEPWPQQRIEIASPGD
jgi:4-amino-4-deoxy-L-arabinose transferase-like glycosyltransferase